MHRLIDLRYVAHTESLCAIRLSDQWCFVSCDRLSCTFVVAAAIDFVLIYRSISDIDIFYNYPSQKLRLRRPV